MNKLKSNIDFAEKVLRDIISKDIEKEFERFKSTVYKELWKEEYNVKTIIETPLETPVIISEDKISFNAGESYIHRSEEKVIKERLDKLKEEIVDHIFNEVISKESTQSLDGIKESREEQTRVEVSEDDLLHAFLKDFSNLPTNDKIDFFNYACTFLELSVINDKIDILYEMDGSKDKILSLLEEKHTLLKELKLR